MKTTLYTSMINHQNPAQVEGLMRFFKTGVGEYGEGDMFLGIKVPVTREIVKQHWKTTDFQELQKCIESPYHEVRLSALLSLIEIFTHAKQYSFKLNAFHPNDYKKNKESEIIFLQKKCVDFYLSNISYINNWDLVDLSCYKLLGVWLLDKERSLLYEMAKNGKTIWKQRIGIVTTMAFIRKGELQDTFDIADILLTHPHDLIQKAVGWLLREAGKKDKGKLISFLESRYRKMPRTMVRYAIEKFSPQEREVYKL